MLIYELIVCNCCLVPLLIQAVCLLKHFRPDLYNEIISSIKKKKVWIAYKIGNKKLESTAAP